MRGWFYYKFIPEISVPYFEEGADTLLLGSNIGMLYQYGNDDNTDDGFAIDAEYDTFTFDGGDPRANKQFANGSIEAEGTIDIEAIADNRVTGLGTTAFSETTRTRETLDFTQEEHKNLMLKVTGQAPWILYNYSHELTFVSVSERTELRKAFATSMVFNEYANLWRCQLTYISNADISIVVTADNGVAQTYTVLNSGGATMKTQVIFQAIKAKLWEVQFQSDADFQIIRDQSVFFVKEFRSTGPYDQTKPFGDDSRAV